MKVLLVQAYLGGNEPLVFPIGLACLAANLDDHEVRACDTNLADAAITELAENLDDFRPDVVGISLRNIDSTNKRKVVFYYAYLRDLLDVVKAHSAAKVVIGGSGFSMYAQEIMETEQRIDLGVYLEGEVVFPRLLSSLENPEAVDSVFYRKDGRVVFSGPGKSQINLNTVPLPKRNLFRLNAYRSIVPDAIGIETKRGCSLSCIYCIYGFLNGKKMRLREPKRIVDEIEALVKEYGIERFTFVDSVFNLPHRHAEAVCKELIDRGVEVRWSAWFNERFTTRELLELAVKAGCTNAIFSPDGFSDKTLMKLGKDLSKADILRVYRMLPNVEGVEFSYNFFKNPPGQTLNNFLSMLLFAAKAKLKLGRRVHFEFNALRVEPHTALYNIALEEGVVKPGESLLFPKYYTNRRTRYIERAFNSMLWLKEKVQSVRARA